MLPTGLLLLKTNIIDFIASTFQLYKLIILFFSFIFSSLTKLGEMAMVSRRGVVFIMGVVYIFRGAPIELVSMPLPVDPHGTSEIVKYEWVSRERK